MHIIDYLQKYLNWLPESKIEEYTYLLSSIFQQFSMLVDNNVTPDGRNLLNRAQQNIKHMQRLLNNFSKEEYQKSLEGLSTTMKTIHCRILTHRKLCKLPQEKDEFHCEYIQLNNNKYI